MMTEQPRRGRPPRSEVIQQQRSRRVSSDLSGTTKNLDIPVSSDLTEGGKYVLRYLSSDERRIWNKTARDDWERVVFEDDKDNNADMGSGLSVRSGTDARGQPETLILHRKLKSLHDEHRAELARRVDATEDEMRRGKTDAADSSTSEFTRDISIRQTGSADE